MQTGITTKQARHDALVSFMGRPTDHKSTGILLEAIGDLSKSSTGYQSDPFVPPQPVGPFWEPPVQETHPTVQPEPQVVLETPFHTLKSTILHLSKKKIPVEKFCEGFEGLHIPNFVVEIFLMKFDFISTDANGMEIVNVVDVRNNIHNFVEMIDIVRMKVDLIDALIGQLRKERTLYWSSFMNSTHDSYVMSNLSRPQKTEVFQLLRVLGVVNSRNDRLILSSQLALLSENDCRIMLWNVVSQSEITTTPHAKAKKCGRTDASQSEVATTSHAKAKKRGRTDLEELQQNQDNRRKLSLVELLKIFFTHLTEYILQRRRFAVSLTEVIDNAFLALSPNDLRQLMEFLSSRDTIWILQRIMMDSLPLTLLFPEKECFLLVHNEFSALSLNMTEIMDKYHLFSMEAISHFEDASRRIHEERVKEEQERKSCKDLDDSVRFLLGNLWRTKDTSAFIDGLRQVYPEFNSNDTNWKLLNFVVYEFLNSIYNATTHLYYHNDEPCVDIAADFIEYMIIRRIFSPKPPIHENIRVCQYKDVNCLFGHKCSGAHQAFVSSGWKKGCVWGTCCPEYSETMRCTNKRCCHAHFTGDEFERAFRKGGKDSNEKRRKLLAQAYITKP